jgi:hypothetical protein
MSNKYNKRVEEINIFKLKKKFRKAWNADSEWFLRNKTLDSWVDFNATFVSKSIELSEVEFNYIVKRLLKPFFYFL